MGVINRLKNAYEGLKRSAIWPTWAPDPITGISPITGVNVNESTTIALSTFWACTQLRADALSEPTIKILKQNDKGGFDENKESIAYQLLNVKPNDFMTPFSWRAAMVYNMILFGNGYSVIERDVKGNAIALMPVIGDTVEVKRVTLKDGSQETIYQIKPDGGDPIIVAKRNMIHWMGLTKNGYVGMSPITYLANTLGIAIAADKQASNQFAQGSTLTGLLSVESKLKQEDLDRIRKGWNKNYNGVSSTSGTAVLDNGAKFQTITMSPQDAQLLETRKFSAIQICQIQKVQPHKVALLERSTNNNIEQQSIEFVQDCLSPDATKLEQEIMLKLMPESEQLTSMVEFDFSVRLRGDTTAMNAKIETMFKTGSITINEIRKLNGLNPITDGDETFIQINTTTLDINKEYYMAKIEKLDVDLNNDTNGE